MSDMWDHEENALSQIMDEIEDEESSYGNRYYSDTRRKVLKDTEIIARSIKALFVRAGKKQAWIPKSQVIEINEDTIIITQWMQDRLNWEKFEPLFPPQKLIDKIKDFTS